MLSDDKNNFFTKKGNIRERLNETIRVNSQLWSIHKINFDDAFEKKFRVTRRSQFGCKINLSRICLLRLTWENKFL